jgi:hypothetical protein
LTCAGCANRSPNFEDGSFNFEDVHGQFGIKIRTGFGDEMRFLFVTPTCWDLLSYPLINRSFIDINASSGIVILPVVYRGFPSSGGGRGWFS